MVKKEILFKTGFIFNVEVLIMKNVHASEILSILKIKLHLFWKLHLIYISRELICQQEVNLTFNISY